MGAIRSVRDPLNSQRVMLNIAAACPVTRYPQKESGAGAKFSLRRRVKKRGQAAFHQPSVKKHGHAVKRGPLPHANQSKCFYVLGTIPLEYEVRQ